MTFSTTRSIFRRTARPHGPPDPLVGLTAATVAAAPLEPPYGEGLGRRRTAFEVRLPGGPPLPLSGPPHPRPHRRLHLPRCQVPPLLPRALPSHFPRPPQAQVPPILLDLRQSKPLSTASGDPDPFQSREPGGFSEEEVDVRRVCKVVEELFVSDRNMEAVLDQCGVSLSGDVVVAVLDRFCHAHKPAYRFFRWAGGRPGFAHDSATYNKMLSVLGRTRQLETMVALLDEMGRKRVLTMDSFKVSITAFAGAREMKKALGIFKMMERYGFDVGIETVNGLLFVLANEKLGKEAQALFDRMKDKYSPDLRTYNVLLSGWCKLKNLVEAGRVWNEMIDSGLRPDIVAHNTMLDGLNRGQRRPEAIKLFELMKAKGPRPTACTYNILINDLCKHGKLERAVACFQEMLGDGCAPDATTYTSLIMGFGKAKQMHEVPGLLKEMKERGCPPDSRMYNAIIRLMTNQNMPDDAARIYRRMIKSGIAPTIHTYNMLMKSYFSVNNYEMGCAVWEEMNERGVCPDDNSYMLLISGLIQQERSEEALMYIKEMIDKGMKVPRFDYNKLVADFRRFGKPDVLYELAQKMSFSGKSAASDVLMALAQRMEVGVVGKGSGLFGQ